LPRGLRKAGGPITTAEIVASVIAAKGLPENLAANLPEKTLTQVQYFSMIELINSVKRSDGPMGNVEGRYRDAKMMLGWDIEAAGESVEAILRGAVHGQIGDLVKMLKKFNGLALQLFFCFEVRALSGSLVSSPPE
jgi:hypothetical protein